MTQMGRAEPPIGDPRRVPPGPSDGRNFFGETPPYPDRPHGRLGGEVGPRLRRTRTPAASLSPGLDFLVPPLDLTAAGRTRDVQPSDAIRLRSPGKKSLMLSAAAPQGWANADSCGAKVARGWRSRGAPSLLTLSRSPSRGASVTKRAYRRASLSRNQWLCDPPLGSPKSQFAGRWCPAHTHRPILSDTQR